MRKELSEHSRAPGRTTHKDGDTCSLCLASVSLSCRFAEARASSISCRSPRVFHRPLLSRVLALDSRADLASLPL